MTDLVAFLREAGAHHDVVRWVETSAPTLSLVWERCPRGDWLLALAARIGAPPEAIETAAVECARLAIEDLELPDAERALDRLVALRSSGGALESVHALRDEAEQHANGATDLGVASAWLAVACACRTSEEPEAASMCAALAVDVAVASVGDCAMAAAAADIQRRSADIARRLVPVPTLP